jgi:hypothetical protein
MLLYLMEDIRINTTIFKLKNHEKLEVQNNT